MIKFPFRFKRAREQMLKKVNADNFYVRNQENEMLFGNAINVFV